MEPSPCLSERRDEVDMKLLMLPERLGTMGLCLSNGIMSLSGAYGSCARKAMSLFLSLKSSASNVAELAGALSGFCAFTAGSTSLPKAVFDVGGSGRVALMT